jgi:hypothetical protein
MFPKSFEALRIETTTDEQGNFTLQGMPGKMKTSLFTAADDDSSDLAYISEVFLEPNESRPRTVSRLGKKPVDSKPAPLAGRYAAILRDCSLSGYRPMLIIADGNDRVREFVDWNFLDYQKNKDVYPFMQLVVSGDSNSLPPADAAFLKERHWPLPAAGRVVAYALDAKGNELGRLDVEPQRGGAAETVAEFIHRHAPPPDDAEQKWNAAFAEAARSNRRVWARVSQRYCGPCFLLTRWMDDQHERLDKDYVMLKIDDVRDVGGKEVAKRLTRGQHHGVPFHAIFDQAGEMLIDSAGPLGNIGYPSAFEGKKQLRKMLLTTRRNLADAEIDELVESVKN